jgi:hypothetical protein
MHGSDSTLEDGPVQSALKSEWIVKTCSYFRITNFKYDRARLAFPVNPSEIAFKPPLNYSSLANCSQTNKWEEFV